MKVIVISIAVFLLCINYAFCQRFRQFYNNPLINNPASTGLFNQTYRYGGAFKREESRGKTKLKAKFQNEYFFLKFSEHVSC